MAGTDAKSKFEAALKILNFGERCHALAALGRELRPVDPSKLEAILDGLAEADAAGPNAAPAFIEQARLIVAGAAKCVGYSRKLLDHPSQAVRFMAVRNGTLLPGEDARAAFLSRDSSLKLKKFLLRCPSLTVDKEVLEHAQQLFYEKDKERIWALVVRVQDQALFEEWFDRLSDWLDSRDRVPSLPQLAQRFPHSMARFVSEGDLKWKWYWAKDVLTAHPELMLRTVLVQGQDRGSGPKKGYMPGHGCQGFSRTVASWGWRHTPDLMLRIVQEISAGHEVAGHGQVDKGGGRGRGRSRATVKVLELARFLIEVTSTRHYLTQNQKLALLMRVYEEVSDEMKDDLSFAVEFIALIPQKAQVSKIIEAGWAIAGGVGRGSRQELLVGAETKPECTTFWKTFARKLPPDQAVEQFFRILDEFEASTDTYSFVQGGICTSHDGRHDSLMLRVFRRYLEKEEDQDEAGKKAAEMFETLLKDAKSRDIIQASFDLLIEYLGNHMEPKLFFRVVQRMQHLERVSRTKDSTVPVATAPIPVKWVGLVTWKEGEKPSPHVLFLLQVLGSGTGDKELLGQMLKLYGHGFFWELLAHVLHATASGSGTILRMTAPDYDVLKAVDVTRFSQIPQSGGGDSPQKSTVRRQGLKAETFSQYFSGMGEAKKLVNSKNPSDREAGYTELVLLAKKDADPLKAFGDCLPFLLQRFDQDSVRVCILNLVVEAGEHFWRQENLQLLKAFYKASLKGRDNMTCSWERTGKKAVLRELCKWPATSDEPSELLSFALEVSNCASELPQLLVTAATKPEEGLKPLEEAAAAKALPWVLRTAVPVTSEVGLPLQTFWATLGTLGNLRKSTPYSERDLWETFPCVGEWWRRLLEHGAKQKAAEFVMVEVIFKLTQKQQSFARTAKQAQRKGVVEASWFAPIECDEYKNAVRDIMEQMERGEIPPKEASSMLSRRINVLIEKARLRPASDFDPSVCNDKIRERAAPKWMVRPRRRPLKIETIASARSTSSSAHKLPGEQWVKEQKWDLPKHHCQNTLPWQMWFCRDDVAAGEVKTLAAVLAKGGRQVLWQVVEVAHRIAGPDIAAVVGEAIKSLDPRFEGMARCIARHYPYLNCALTKGEVQDGSSDVLTPLLEIWLLEDATRDARIAQLMKRPDCEYFLFFGTSFSRHLSNMRQEWLHACLSKLKGPGDGDAEFYHYPRRGPTLRQVAQLRSGSEGFRKMLRDSGTDDGVPEAVQMYLWHPDTQNEFLTKALQSTDSASLALIPRAEHADSVAFVARVLDRYPSEPQKAKDRGGDLWGWEVIQAAGAYSSLQGEVERRFSELPGPPFNDAVDDLQVEVLLTALGRADDAARALSVLGRYAGKVKRAKEAVTKMISKVSPPRARDLIRDVMLEKKSGVGMQVAGLNLLVDLRIPRPLELYRMAWRKGNCQRDVAAKVLAKVATATEFKPEEVRDFFDCFDQANQGKKQDKWAYVADALMTELNESTDWTLPYMPEVVAKFVMLPGLTSKAAQALLLPRTHLTAVLKALTEVLKVAKLAEFTMAPQATEPKASLLRDLNGLTTTSAWSCRIIKLNEKAELVEADPAVLEAFIDEAFETWVRAEIEAAADDEIKGGKLHESVLFSAVMDLWAFLLRRGQGEAAWSNTMMGMYRKLIDAPGLPQSLEVFAGAVVKRVRKEAEAPLMDISAEEYDGMLRAAGALIRRIIEESLTTESESPQGAGGGPKRLPDLAFVKATKNKETVRKSILFSNYGGLLAHGCPEAELNSLLALCLKSQEVELAKSLVEKAVSLEREALGDDQQKLGPRTQRRPDEGWKHTGGMPIDAVKVGSEVSGTITNSSSNFGVFVNFGCVRDGKLSVPQSEWKKYHVGDFISNMVVKSVSTSKNTGTDFIELLLTSDKKGAGRREVSSGGGSLQVGHRAVRWLASLEETCRTKRWASLAQMWASLVALDFDGSVLQERLKLLGDAPPMLTNEKVFLVEELLSKSPAKPVARAALEWLRTESPSDAVRLWPAVLTPTSKFERVEREDMEALLKMCAEGGQKLPKIRPVVARGLSDEVLECLLASSLPEARLVGIQTLQERAVKQQDGPPDQLKELRKDSCYVVRLAADLLWKDLGGEPDPEEAEEDEDGEEGAENDAAGGKS